MTYSSFLSYESARQRAEDRSIPLISRATEHWLRSFLADNPPTNCLEIGTAIGYSSRLISEYTAGHLWSFEISHPAYMTALAHHQTAQILNTTLYYGNILDVPLERVLPGSIDFCFIDAQKSEYLSYAEKVLPYLALSHTLIFDDIKQYAHKTGDITTWLQEHKYSYHVEPLSDNDALLIAHSGGK